MQKNKLSKYLLFISVTTFLAVFFHIVSQSYANLIKPTQIATQSSLLKPIDTDYDLKTLETIKSKQQFEGEYLENSNVIIVTPTPAL